MSQLPIRVNLTADTQAPEQDTAALFTQAPQYDAATVPLGNLPSPQSSVPQTSPPSQPSYPGQDDDLSFFDYVGDVVKGIANGPVNSVNETIDLAGTLLKGGEEVDVAKATQGSGWFTDMSNFGETKTSAGKFAEDVSTFVSGFVTGGKLLEGVKLLQGAGKGAIAARGAAKSFYSTVTSFDGHEEMLSNMIQEHPTLQNVVTEALAVSKDDNEIVGRIKHGLEDLGIGMALEGAISLYGGWKLAQATSKSAKEKIVAETARQLEQLRGDKEVPHDPAAGTAKGEPPVPFASGGKEAAPSAPEEQALSEPRPVEEPAPTKRGEQLLKPSEDIQADTVKEHILDVVTSTKSRDEVVKNLSKDYNIRTHLIRDENGLRILDDINEQLSPATLKGQGVETFDDVLKEAERLKEYGMDTIQKVVELAASGDVPLNRAKRTLTLLKDGVEFCSRELYRIAEKMEVNPSAVSPQEVQDFVYLKENIDNLYLAERNLTTEGGRLLSFMRNEGGVFGDERMFKWYASPSGMTSEQIAGELAKKGYTPDTIKKMARDVRLNNGNLGAVAQTAHNVKPGSWFNVVNEFRINNMLSGPFTLGANAMTNGLKTLLMPAEKYLAGAIMRDDAVRREALDTFSGLFRYWNESFRLAKKAWKVEDNILDRVGGKMETHSAALTYENIRNLMLKEGPKGAELSPLQENIARAMGLFGPYLRIPSRLLMSTDEFFKQLNYRASLSASLLREGREAGIKDAGELAHYVEEQLALAFKKDGSVIRGRSADDAVKDSLLYARESTWTQDLGRDTLGGGIQSLANAHPVLRIAVPFIKTPTNLFRDFVAHTPGVAQLTKSYREAIKAGGEQAALAQSKVAMGALMWTGAVIMAHGGQITGSPPKDPKLRQALEATGWQPYSIKVGDKYLSYRRLDPAGMFLGIAADLAVAGQYLDKNRYDDAVSMAVAALSNNVTSKTYMQGISELIDFINDPNEKAIQYFGRMGATFVPFASAARFARQQIDDPMREMRDFMDYTMNTIPGWSSSLPARRNWVTGETVNYNLIPSNADDKVLDELNRMAQGIYGPPAKKLHGIELSAAQYSRLNELHGTATIGGKTLHEALRELFESEGYDIDRNVLGDPPDKERGPRAVAINRIIHAYRRKAQDDLLSEDDVLRQEVRKSDFQRLASKRGTMTENNQQELLDALLEY